VLKCLRAATRDAHSSVECAPILARLTKPDLTREGYLTALRVLYGFHAAYNAVLPGLLKEEPKSSLFGPSAALGALRRDLQFLGEHVLDTTPILENPPPNTAAAIGALYVLEGSALGGRVIGRHVSLALRVGPGQGGDFFCAATADQARERWRRFCDFLDQTGQEEGRIADICEGANATFKTLSDWLVAFDASGRPLGDSHLDHVSSTSVAA
jgi:heme oxygenase